MPTADDDREVTGWRTASKFYRQPPGWGWLFGLLVVPLLLGLMGWSGLNHGARNAGSDLPSVNPSATLTAPAMTAPAMTGPGGAPQAPNFASFSMARKGNGFVLSGDLPDADVKNGLLSSLRAAFGPDVQLDDKLAIKPGGTPPEFAGLGGVLGASIKIPDFSFAVDRDTVTLTGTAPSEAVKADVEAAAKEAWPNIKVVNNIEVRAASAPVPTQQPPAPAPTQQPPAPTPGGQCASLQADVNGLLRTPVNFATDGFNLTPPSQQLLTTIAGKVKSCPDARIAVVGHTDDTGNDAINIPLSGSRAKSVADYLISKGVVGDHVTSRGVGAAEPVAPNNTAAGRAQNRRVAITVN